MREWFTRQEILAVGSRSLPSDRRSFDRLVIRNGWRDTDRVRQRAGRGGGFEYHHSLLPADVAARLLQAPTPNSAANDDAPPPGPEAFGDPRMLAMWGRFDALPDKGKQEAARRLKIVRQVKALREGGADSMSAVTLVAAEAAVATSTIWNWWRATAGLEEAHWLAALAPAYTGRTAKAECHPQAWEFIKADYMRPERPGFAACHRRMLEAAAAHGWSPIPASKTLQRRLEREVPRGAMVMARDGRDAAKRLYPHQTRDRSGFEALQAVNADGHRFDVFCKFEDGTIGRPMMVAIQDLFSGMIVAHRIDRTENRDAVRLAFADLVTQFGIPETAYLDNGRAFASKWMTGGVATRFRFKVRAEEPTGILVGLGIKPVFVTPYSGQSKPIERAFRDLCEEIARHPFCAGAYTGNAPDAKPENYQSKAIPIAEFKTLVAAELQRHNERPGRTGGNCAGRSFRETLDAGMLTALVKRATPAQSRLLLLAAEGIAADRKNGEIKLAGNRYWAAELVELAGRRLIVRFDPDALQAGIAVYTNDGRFVAEAECIEAAGFADTAAAREHASRRNAWLKNTRERLDIERQMGIAEVAALMPSTVPAQQGVTPSVVRLMPAAATRPDQIAAIEPDHVAESFGRAVQALSDGQSADVLSLPKKKAGAG